MSEDNDKESKTEEASEKKTRDAIERGEVAVSRDLMTWGAFAGICLALGFARNDSFTPVIQLLATMLDNAGGWRLQTGADAWILTQGVVMVSAHCLIPICAILICAILAASLGQNLPRFVLKRIQPDFSRISVKKGFARIFSKKGTVEFLKSVVKLAIGSVVAASSLRASQGALIESSLMDARDVAKLGWTLATKLALAIASVTALFAIIDLVIVRFDWKKNLRMSKQEMKDEMKQSEGDPLMKSRLRSLAMDRNRRRMIADVEKASVVLVNPVHYAIALRYVREEGGAPLVLAKGQELIALKIKERAIALGIPVIENPPLVRAMYDHVEVSQMIPTQFYRAIADVINLISKKKAGYGSGI